MAVAKPELGIKRQCGNCGAKFYDLAKSPILCPKCGTVYEVAAAPARRAATPKAAAPAQEEAVPVADTETVSLEEVAEQENKSASPKGAPPDDVETDDEVEVEAGDDTFLEEEEEEAGDVSDLIGEGIDKKEEET
jgi:uncharacterized protein (TIGR02300 family)